MDLGVYYPDSDLLGNLLGAFKFSKGARSSVEGDVKPLIMIFLFKGYKSFLLDL